MVHSSNATAINAQITKINNILKQLRVRFYAAQRKKKNNSNVMIIHPV
jgi:outer membrane murein-binding lipoprotein Lpp